MPAPGDAPPAPIETEDVQVVESDAGTPRVFMRISELSAAAGPGSPTTAPPRARPAEPQRVSTGGADCVMLRVSTPGDGAAGSSADPLPNPSANPARAASFPVSAAAPREPKLAKPSAAKLRWMRADPAAGGGPLGSRLEEIPNQGSRASIDDEQI